MSRKSLLYIVQNMLVIAGSDQVDSIEESTEAEDVANLAREVFYDIMEWDEWPSSFKLTTLEPASDLKSPTVVRMMQDVKQIDRVQYLIEDETPYFKTLHYLRPEEFLCYNDAYMDKDDSIRASGYGVDESFVIIRTDADPTYYTSFDGTYIYLDSVNKSVDSTVQSSKLRVFAEIIPEFEIADKFVVPIPDTLMNLYLAELRQAVLYYLNQSVSQLDSKKSLRAISDLRANKERTHEEDYRQSGFGRRGPGTFSTSLGRRRNPKW